MRKTSLVAMLVIATTVITPVFAQAQMQPSPAPGKAPPPAMANVGNSPRGMVDEARNNGAAGNPALKQEALFYNRKLLSEVKNALKRTDLTEDERQALSEKKAQIERDIVALQQE